MAKKTEMRTAAERERTKEASGKTLRIQYVRSAIGFTKRQKETVRGLGLTKLNQVVVRPDTPQVRGMIEKIPHLVTILESQT